ncbi:hypothetical protein AB0H49_32050 [Nocardia sp. NPDC050713]|uniref:hypothetical protein n=1 Tax=Nocardia sp. NPDC050713 TaxID=3154511 RepID=UPI0033C678C6
MAYRAYRDNRVPDIAGLCEDVTYRIPGVPHEFVINADLLCGDCSVPIIEFRNRTSGKTTRAQMWHDGTCPTADDEVKIKPRILHRQ